MSLPERVEPGPGQESVWDYPRPPRLEMSTRRVQVWFEGTLIADSERAARVLETYHPPTWYLPPDDVYTQALRPVGDTSFCEWKGLASYFDVAIESARVPRAAWTYIDPTPPFATIASWIGFFPRLVECVVDGARAEPQAGGFYGGWVTPDVTGPFKGVLGMDGW